MALARVYPTVREATVTLLVAAPQAHAQSPSALSLTNDNAERSARRAASSIRRYVIANGIDVLGTLTFARPVVELAEVRAHISRFMRRLRVQGYDRASVWVAEWHPQGHGWHVHLGLVAPVVSRCGWCASPSERTRWKVSTGLPCLRCAHHGWSERSGRAPRWYVRWVGGRPRYSRVGGRRWSERQPHRVLGERPFGGFVHVQQARGNNSPAKTARYLAKYLTTDFEELSKIGKRYDVARGFAPPVIETYYGSVGAGLAAVIAGLAGEICSSFVSGMRDGDEPRSVWFAWSDHSA